MRAIGKAAFTVLELLVACTVIAIIAALLFPVISAARGRAVQTSCLNNIAQISKALLMYQDDLLELPRVSGAFVNGWHVAIRPYLGTGARWKCPLLEIWPNGSPYVTLPGYALNTCLHRHGSSYITDPSRTVLVAEIAAENCGGVWNIDQFISRPNTWTRPTDPWGCSWIAPLGDVRHRGGANYAFTDGHVKWHRPSDFMVGVIAKTISTCFPDKTFGPSDGPTFCLQWRQ